MKIPGMKSVLGMVAIAAAEALVKLVRAKVAARSERKAAPSEALERFAEQGAADVKELAKDPSNIARDIRRMATEGTRAITVDEMLSGIVTRGTDVDPRG